jgi:hypothetical protein
MPTHRDVDPMLASIIGSRCATRAKKISRSQCMLIVRACCAWNVAAMRALGKRRVRAS